MLFKNSYHVFDHEYSIEEEFNELNILVGNRTFDGYRFEDSKNNRLIQVSDVFVGLTGRYFTFLNDVELERIDDVVNEMTFEQLTNLKLLNSLVDKSHKKNMTLIESNNPKTEAYKRGIFLERIGSAK